MNLDELIGFVYEDLNAQIGCVRLENDVYIVELECDDPEENKRRHFVFHFVGVVEANVAPYPVGAIFVPKEHVLLLQYLKGYGILAFSSAPSDPSEVISVLYETHHAVFGDWRHLSWRIFI